MASVRILVTLLGAVLGSLSIYSLALAAPPTNDTFADAIVISGCPGTIAGSNSGATEEPGEPNHEGGTGSSIWYAWTAPFGGPVSFDTAGSTTDDPRVSEFVPSVTVYTGAANPSVDALTPVPTIHGATYHSRPLNVTFNAQAGVTYYLAAQSAQSLGPDGPVQG
jgi:hypothetical protein